MLFERRRLRRRRAQSCSSLPFLSREKEERRDRRVLGTTLGRACSRWCRERRVRSKIGWLAGSRDSHHVSRFAAFFILARAEISVDGSCFGVSRFSLFCYTSSLNHHKEKRKEKVFKNLFPLSCLLFLSPSLFSNSFEGIREKEGAPSGVRNGRPLTSLKREGEGTPTFRIWVTRG